MNKPVIGKMRELYQISRLWERLLMSLRWIAPITLEQVKLEIDEAIATPPSAKGMVEEELGDALQILFRYAEKHDLDLEGGLQRSLAKNFWRTNWVLQNNPEKIPATAETTKYWWELAKRVQRGEADVLKKEGLA